jgi:hypothetical protein
MSRPRRSRRGRGKRKLARLLRQLNEHPNVNISVQPPPKEQPQQNAPHKFGIFTILPERPVGGIADWQPWVDDPCLE